MWIKPANCETPVEIGGVFFLSCRTTMMGLFCENRG